MYRSASSPDRRGKEHARLNVFDVGEKGLSSQRSARDPFTGRDANQIIDNYRKIVAANAARLSLCQ
jgi:hypothetical protein